MHVPVIIKINLSQLMYDTYRIKVAVLNRGYFLSYHRHSSFVLSILADNRDCHFHQMIFAAVVGFRHLFFHFVLVALCARLYVFYTPLSPILYTVCTIYAEHCTSC